MAMFSYDVESGACRAGFDILNSAAARTADSVSACTQACTEHGASCVSASWFSEGRTVYKKVRSQCWLSSTCVAPDCCWSGFSTHVKRVPGTSAAANQERDGAESEDLLAGEISLANHKAPSATGVLQAFIWRGPQQPRAILSEAARSARVLRAVMSPPFPTVLLANHIALASLNASEATGAWDSALELTLHAELKPILQRMRRPAGADGAPALPDGWHVCRTPSDAGCAESPFLWKLSALLHSPFARTLYLDVDVFVLWPPLAQMLLQRTLALCDVAMPIDVGRFFGPWSSTPAPPLCSCMIAFSNTSAVRQLWGRAARMLITGQGSSRVRRSDQEMIWLAWARAQSGGQSGGMMRMLALPEETYCPGLQYQKHNSSSAFWHTAWLGSQRVEHGKYRCKAVHTHGYSDEQLVRLTDGKFALVQGGGRSGG